MKLPKALEGEDNCINVIIETPMGSRNKFEYDEDADTFKLGKVLPAGSVFPHHFGFIPRTKGGDGDPLDVLVLLEIPTFPGNLLACRVVGIIEAEQTEKNKKTTRNDRLIAIPMESHDYAKVHSVRDLEKNVLKEICSFFKYYNSASGKKFKVLDIKGRKAAFKLVQDHIEK